MTPLVEEHIRRGGKMVDFAGWKMPVEFKGLRHEHQVVREKVGLFDVSHMGEIRVSGPAALATAEWLTTNEVAKLKAGQAQYTLLPNAEGGVVDDLIVYCIRPREEYLFCVNASNIDKDFAWMQKNNRGAQLRNESPDWGQIAVQGPKAIELLKRVIPGEPPGPFEFKPAQWQGQEVLVARTGYTGEDGVEIFVPATRTAKLWSALLEKGEDLGVEPIGLGARDTLRTEMKYPLYGHELDDKTNPYAAGLGWVVKPAKKDFIGREVMLNAKEKGLRQKLIGFKMRDRGIARQGYKLFSKEGEKVGVTTSGTMSPTLTENIGIGYIDTRLADVGSQFHVEIRGRMTLAETVPTPFVNVKK